MSKIKQEHLLNEFQFKAQYAKINSLEYVKDLEEVIRDLVQINYKSKYYEFRYIYSIDELTKEEQKTFEYIYRLLTLAFKKFKEKTQKELPEKITGTYKRLQENVLFVLFEDNTAYSYDEIVKITKNSDYLYFNGRNELLFNFIKICKSHSFHINYDKKMTIEYEIARSDIENKAMLILLEFKHKELNNSNNFAIWNELYKYYYPEKLQQKTQQNIDKYKLRINCIEQLDKDIRNHLEKYTGENGHGI